MSYKHLAGRLVETQRSMLGQPAIEIAQSVDGLTVTDDGNVTSIGGDERVTIDELVERYGEVLGGPARARLQTAAGEFEEELDLPPSLGGPDQPEEADETGDSDESDSGDEGPDEPPGTPIEVRSPRESEHTGGGEPVELTAEATIGTRGSMREVVTATALGVTRRRDADGGATLREPTIVNYTTPKTIVREDETGGNLASIFLLIEDEDGWQSPITVEDAVLDAVVEATDLRRDELGDLVDYVDPECVLSVLGSEGAVPISFGVEGLTVTLHPGGMLQLH